ncbi:hypothetical protein IAU59_004785 [Kwoniella sp. CBS 9459]
MAGIKITYTASYKRAGQALTTAAEWLSDERMSRCKILHWLSDKIDRTPSALANAALFFLLSVLALNPSGLSPVLTNGLGLVSAAYGSFSHLNKGDVGLEPLSLGGKKKDAERQYREKSKRWLDYWLVYATSLVVESVAGEDIVSAAVPLWWATKGLAIIWFLVGFSDGARKEVIKPKPLRLRLSSKIASRVQASSTPTPVVAPAPSSKGRHVNDGDDEDSSEGQIAVDPETALSASYQQRAGTLDRTLHRRLAADETVVLSATPVIPHKPRRSSGGRQRSDSQSDSEMSSPFDLSDGSASNSESSESNTDDDETASEESDSEEDSDIRSQADSESDESPSASESEASPGTASDSPSSAASGSYHDESSDEADEVVLPPGTPLDELALRGIKTVQTPVSPLVEDTLTQAIESAVLSQQPDPDEEKEGRSSEVGKQEEIVMSDGSDAPVTDKRASEAGVNIGKTGPEVDKHERQESQSFTDDVPTRVLQTEATNEGEVVKLSLEELLAMDDDPPANDDVGKVTEPVAELVGENAAAHGADQVGAENMANGVTAPLQFTSKRGDKI